MFEIYEHHTNTFHDEPEDDDEEDEDACRKHEKYKFHHRAHHHATFSSIPLQLFPMFWRFVETVRIGRCCFGMSSYAQRHQMFSRLVEFPPVAINPDIAFARTSTDVKWRIRFGTRFLNESLIRGKRGDLGFRGIVIEVRGVRLPSAIFGLLLTFKLWQFCFIWRGVSDRWTWWMLVLTEASVLEEESIICSFYLRHNIS